MKDVDQPADSVIQASAPVSEATAGTEALTETPPAGFDNLYKQARAEEFGLTLREFAEVLYQVGQKYLPAGSLERPSKGSDVIGQGVPAHLVSGEALAFYGTLRLEELALARACAKGVERAWEIFLKRYREKLYDAARSIAREESAAREIADSIYADLYGTPKGEKPRVSKLSFYTGRGSLEGWLRTVLAQEYVNRYRAQRRLVSIEEREEAGVELRATARESNPEVAAMPDPRLEAATDEALQSLAAEDRYILASYYLDGRTLAEIARVLDVHESTISRKAEKIVKGLRKRIVEGLRARGMSRDQAEEALEADVRDLGLDVRGRLAAERRLQEKGSGSVP